MRRWILAAAALTGLSLATVAQQSPASISYRPPAPSLKPGMVELAVEDATTGSGVPYPLLCLNDNPDTWVVGDPEGGIRIGGLDGATRIRIEALGYAPDSVVLDAADDTRRAATARLMPRTDERVTLACE